MDWLEFTLLVPAADADAAAEALRRHCPGGASIELPILPAGEEGYEPDPARPATVRAYLPRRSDVARRRRALRRELVGLGLASALRTRWRREEEWAEAWKRFFGVERVGTRLVVCPTWVEYTPQGEEALIRLDPGMAFGTGQHATTRLCLEALESRLRSEQRAPVAVLDVGTGSGILAIAAALLGAARVVAVDINPVAVAVARQNVAINRVEGRVRVLEGTLDAAAPVEEPRFEVVLANISSAAIIEMAPAQATVLAPGGALIASGIGEAAAEDCRGALERAGLRVMERIERDGWCAFVCTAP